MSLHFLHPAERLVVSAILSDADAAGYFWTIFGPDQWSVRSAGGRTVPMAMLGPDDDSIIEFYDPAKLDIKGDPVHLGTILLAHGNGSDVVWSYTPTPEIIALAARHTPRSVVAERFGAPCK